MHSWSKSLNRPALIAAGYRRLAVRRRRRRECLSCNERFTTFETAELVMPRVIKSDGTREPFNEQKLRAGMLRALEKRPVSVEDLEAAISRLCHRLRATGEREVPARQVGGFVMEALQQLDDVAYVRFASVYRSFQDISEFAAEVDRLRGRAGGGEPQDDDTPQQ